MEKPHQKETCAKWLASGLSNTSPFSQEIQGAQRSREQESLEILRRALGPCTTEIKSNAPAPLVLTRGTTPLEPKKMTTGGRGPGGGVTHIRQVQAIRSRQDSLWLSFTNDRDDATYPHREVWGPHELDKREENCEPSRGACERMAADQFLSCLSPGPSPASLRHFGVRWGGGAHGGDAQVSV